MSVYTFKKLLDFENVTSIDRDLPFLDGKRLIEITFDYFYEPDFADWHCHVRGTLTVLMLKDFQSGMCIEPDSLPLETKIHIRSLCIDYLDKYHLEPYANVIAIESYPIRWGSLEPQDNSRIAEIIPFPVIPDKSENQA